MSDALLSSPARRAYRMFMLLEPTYFTADMVRALPDDGNRYELVWGELLVSPSPRVAHQRVVRRLLVQVASYCDTAGTCEAWISPADISWGDDTLVQPDIFVVPNDESRSAEWTAMQHLMLVAEVLSPSTARHDRFAKRRLYQHQGVPVVWLIDVERAQVEVWTPDDLQPTIVRDQLTWRVDDEHEPLVIDLAELFRGA